MIQLAKLAVVSCALVPNISRRTKKILSQIILVSMEEKREEKRYKCEECCKTFKKKYYHIKHLKMSHSYFDCDKCGKKVKEGAGLCIY